MPTSKREQAHTERRLVTALTQACETAIDTLANKHAALACAMDERMIELTREAFDEAQVSVANVSAHVHVDSEQECLHENGGDWQQRIRRKYSKRG